MSKSDNKSDDLRETIEEVVEELLQEWNWPWAEEKTGDEWKSEKGWEGATGAARDREPSTLDVFDQLEPSGEKWINPRYTGEERPETGRSGLRTIAGLLGKTVSVPRDVPGAGDRSIIANTPTYVSSERPGPSVPEITQGNIPWKPLGKQAYGRTKQEMEDYSESERKEYQLGEFDPEGLWITNPAAGKRMTPEERALAENPYPENTWMHGIYKFSQMTDHEKDMALLSTAMFGGSMLAGLPYGATRIRAPSFYSPGSLATRGVNRYPTRRAGQTVRDPITGEMTKLRTSGGRTDDILTDPFPSVSEFAVPTPALRGKGGPPAVRPKGELTQNLPPEVIAPSRLKGSMRKKRPARQRRADETSGDMEFPQQEEWMQDFVQSTGPLRPAPSSVSGPVPPGPPRIVRTASGELKVYPPKGVNLAPEQLERYRKIVRTNPKLRHLFKKGLLSRFKNLFESVELREHKEQILKDRYEKLVKGFCKKREE